MSILNFKQANCKNCYKCLRTCPVKAISFVGTGAQVIDDKCVLCGHCIEVCPQNAKNVQTNYESIIKAIAEGKKVVASVAPSFISNFCDLSRDQLFSAILKLGFSSVEETAEGAKFVTDEYDKLLSSGKYKNLITSACPAVVTLIKYSYHEALPYLAPVVSPMVAHAKIIKEKYGDDVLVAFIGPCIAKKREAEKSGVVDFAITFEELVSWFNDEKVVPSEVEIVKTIPYKDKALFYPVPRGIIKSFKEYNGNYDYIYIDGLEECKEVLDNIENLKGVMLELSACDSSCINGPCGLKNKGGFIKANEQVRNYAKANASLQNKDKCTVNLEVKYMPKKDNMTAPTESEINNILAKIGKKTKEDQLNCGACGYETCRQKATAVHNGLASLEMCLPYMRDRAESICTEIIMSSPSGVIALDTSLNIVEINEQARELFGIKDREVKGKALVDYINPTQFILAINGIEKVVNKKVYIDNTDKWVELSIFNVAQHNLVFCTAKDITSDEKYKTFIKKVQLDTAYTTSKVIEKQMSIVQEIASLLGETTAETKIALTKLKNAIAEEDKK